MDSLYISFTLVSLVTTLLLNFIGVDLLPNGLFSHFKIAWNSLRENSYFQY